MWWSFKWNVKQNFRKIGPRTFNIHNREFACDIISNKFCKSSYSWPPCWFPTRMGWYMGKAKKCFIIFFSSYHIIKLQLSDKVHTLGWNFKSFHKVDKKIKRFLFLSSIPRCTKGNQQIFQNCVCVNLYRVIQTLYWRKVEFRSIDIWLVSFWFVMMYAMATWIPFRIHPSTVTNPTMEPFCIFLPLIILPCLTTLITKLARYQHSRWLSFLAHLYWNSPFPYSS